MHALPLAHSFIRLLRHIVCLVPLLIVCTSNADSEIDNTTNNTADPKTPSNTTDVTGTELHQLLARLTQAEQLHCQFEQRKNMEILRRPLVSNGYFYLHKKTGIVWDVRDPFAERLVITHATITRHNESGSIAVTRGNDPAAFAFGRFLLGLFAGQSDDVLALFTLDALDIRPDGAWHARLRANQKNLQQFVAAVELTGNTHLESVRISDSTDTDDRAAKNGGNHTRIQFGPCNTGDTPLPKAIFELLQQPETGKP